jgi:hypothetical protein
MRSGCATPLRGLYLDIHHRASQTVLDGSIADRLGDAWRVGQSMCSNQQIKIGFKKMDDADFVQFYDAWLLVNHDIDHLNPAPQVEATCRRRGCKAMRLPFS